MFDFLKHPETKQNASEFVLTHPKQTECLSFFKPPESLLTLYNKTARMGFSHALKQDGALVHVF